jgi:membrane protein implicated in regulation of membrane protease activity
MEEGADQAFRVSAGRGRAAATLRRYLLFQLPGWLVVGVGLALAVRWWGLPLPWALVGFAAWLAKDALLYPIVRRSYEPDGFAPHGPIGERGVAETAVDTEGWVRVGPERWRARRAPGAGAIAPGAPVRVVRLRGHELEVEPAGAEAPAR